MKYIFSLILSLLLFNALRAQAPDIQWQNTIGSNGDDYLVSIYQLPNGNYLLGGYTDGGPGDRKIQLNLYLKKNNWSDCR